MNQSQVLDHLGIQGGKPLPFAPVVVLADFSETAVGEFIEARGFAGIDGAVSVANGDFAVAALECRSGGGLVVSDLSTSYPRLPASAQPLLGGHDADTWAVGVLPIADVQTGAYANFAGVTVGSTAPTSLPGLNLEGAIAFPTFGDNFLTGTFRLQPGTRWFVPAGSALVLQSNAVRNAGNDIEIFVSFTWRELAPVTRR